MHKLFEGLCYNHTPVNNELSVKTLNAVLESHQANRGIAGQKSNGQVVVSFSAMAAILSTSSLHQDSLLSPEQRVEFTNIVQSAQRRLQQSTNGQMEAKLWSALVHAPFGVDGESSQIDPVESGRQDDDGSEDGDGEIDPDFEDEPETEEAVIR